MSVTYKINGKSVSKRELRQWEKNRREVFGVVPPWECPGSAPGIRTADTFFRGKKQGVTDEDFSPGDMERYRQEAEQSGVSTHNKFYFGQLADGPADNEAWCADESDVIATAKRKKMAVTIGGKTYDFRDKYRDPENAGKPYRVNDRAVACAAENRIDDEYEGRVTEKQREEIYEQTREQLTPGYI